MALSEKELKAINRHCTCGKPNFLFVKYYKKDPDSDKWLQSAGIFSFCNDPHCTFYFKHFITLETIRTDKFMQEDCYYKATGFTLENLIKV